MVSEINMPVPRLLEGVQSPDGWGIWGWKFPNCCSCGGL